MKKVLWIVGVSLLLVTGGVAEENGDISGNLDENGSWVDDYHESISEEVVEWAESIDRTLYEWLGGDEENATARHTATDLERERKNNDAFFQTRKYLNETSRAYIRLRVDTSVRSLESDDTNFHVRVHLPLSRTRKRLKFFIEDLNEDNAENLVKRSDETTESDSPKFGLNYFAPEAYGIHSKYSLGLSGLHPYVRGRYNMVFEPGVWVIEPVQTFQYSERSDFSEWTNLYFDTEPWEETLFRIRLSRGTRAHEKGMPYGIALSFSRETAGHSGVRLVQSFAGHTRYEYTPDGSDETRRYSGIYNYTTAVGYRRSVWKKWLYLEAIPSVNFHKEHDYRPNYSFFLLFDLFFGNYR
jgi:hypothetical protein